MNPKRNPFVEALVAPTVDTAEWGRATEGDQKRIDLEPWDAPSSHDEADIQSAPSFASINAPWDRDEAHDEFEAQDNPIPDQHRADPWDRYDPADDWEIDCGAHAINETAVPPRRTRGVENWRKAVSALQSFIDQDPAVVGARERLREAQDRVLREQAMLGAASEASHISYSAARESVTDFHLVGLGAIAEKLAACGAGSPTYGRCGSYWCPHCRNMFGARLLNEVCGALLDRYRGLEASIRDSVCHMTVLNEIVIPDPDIHAVRVSVEAPVLTENFSASVVRRDHLDIRRFLARWQRKHRAEMLEILGRKAIPAEAVTDDDHDRRSPTPESFARDAAHLIELQETIVEARRKFGREKRDERMTDKFISRREAGREHEYLRQFKHSRPLTLNEVFRVARALQIIYRDFSSITQTRFPDRLKLKSSVEEIIKRERQKLYTITQDLPNIGIRGSFELELVDLHHVLGGPHTNTRKAETIRLLASQPRTPAQRMSKLKNRLLDEVRDKIADGEMPPKDGYEQLRHSVLVHLHAIVDLNGTREDDLRKWLTGRGPSDRKFTGKWPLPHQVRLTSLYTDKDVHKSLVDLCFYPFKAATAYNYAMDQNARREESDRHTVEFSNEELAILVWLQQSMGHEALSIDINWHHPVVENEEAPRGRRKKARKSLMALLPDEEEFIANIATVIEIQGRTRLFPELRKTQSSGRMTSIEALYETDAFGTSRDPAHRSAAALSDAPGKKEVDCAEFAGGFPAELAEDQGKNEPE